jgi:hypothetical protein
VSVWSSGWEDGWTVTSEDWGAVSQKWSTVGEWGKWGGMKGWSSQDWGSMGQWGVEWGGVAIGSGENWSRDGIVAKTVVEVGGSWVLFHINTWLVGRNGGSVTEGIGCREKKEM